MTRRPAQFSHATLLDLNSLLNSLMSQPDPEAINLGDEIASKEGIATGYGILNPTMPGCIW
jgi:hypothetical protein